VGEFDATLQTFQVQICPTALERAFPRSGRSLSARSGPWHHLHRADLRFRCECDTGGALSSCLNASCQLVRLDSDWWRRASSSHFRWHQDFCVRSCSGCANVARGACAGHPWRECRRRASGPRIGRVLRGRHAALKTTPTAKAIEVLGSSRLPLPITKKRCGKPYRTRRLIAKEVFPFAAPSRRSVGNWLCKCRLIHGDLYIGKRNVA